MGDAATTIVLDTPAWVLLALEAKARGFRNALALRRWCRRRSIPLRKDGKMLWVRRADIDAAIEALAAPQPAANDDEARERAMAEAAADAITGARKR